MSILFSLGGLPARPQNPILGGPVCLS